jgi:4-methyl-5(b-hydroxyethyl)-thiazole monophosphate biosynthesis
MAKTVLVVLADGFEEIEAVTPIDVLRRAGLEVTVAGVGKKRVEGAHGVRFEADVELERFSGTPDAIVLPGGMPGAKNLAASRELAALLGRLNAAGKVIGAICAAPGVVLAPQGLLEGRKATCYPGYEKGFGPKTTFTASRVVWDGNVVTSRGPGSALEFALELAAKLAGEAVAAKLSEGMLAPAAAASGR